MDRRAWALLLILGAIWGASYLFIKIGLRDLSPGMVSWLRVVLAAIVLVPLAVRRGGLANPREMLLILVLLAGVQVAGPFMLIALGEQEISSSLAGILVSSAPLFTALLAIWIDHEERSTGLRLAGVGLGLAGVVVLLGVDLSGSGAALLGGAQVVLASLGSAIGGVIAKHRLKDAEPLPIAATVMAASAVLLAPVGLATGPGSMPAAGPLAAVVALGLLGTGIAFAIFYSLIGWVGPARTLVVTYIAPAFAVVYGVWFLDEEITVATLAGLALIVGGSWLAAGGVSVAEEPTPAGPAELPVGDHAS
ncbi:MAG: DMT family transporter [Solirubrobacterales bacterium]